MDQNGPGETRMDQERPDGTRRDQNGPGETRRDQNGPGETRMDQERPEETRRTRKVQGPGGTRRDWRTARGNQKRPAVVSAGSRLASGGCPMIKDPCSGPPLSRAGPVSAGELSGWLARPLPLPDAASASRTVIKGTAPAVQRAPGGRWP